jgi:4-hydroxy-4-methyl-2-oxoglutarate aldolase
MKPPYVVRNIPRPDPAVASELAEHGVATVHESQARTGLMDASFRPIFGGARICGPAVTALCHTGDNLMLHAAIELLQPGDVLVVTTISPTECGMVGELIATALKGRGAAGLILDACVRDLAELREMGFPIWSRGVCASGSVKQSAGWANVPVSVGGAIVNPGDLVLADDDGVVIVPRLDSASVLAAARARVEKENTSRARIERGELSLDYNNLRDLLRKQGVRYFDSAEEVV